MTGEFLDIENNLAITDTINGTRKSSAALVSGMYDVSADVPFSIAVGKDDFIANHTYANGYKYPANRVYPVRVRQDSKISFVSDGSSGTITIFKVTQ
jgi:hypothetical protein